MDYKVKKILEFLQEKGVGIQANIAPILTDLFPVNNPDDLIQRRNSWNQMFKLLDDIREKNFVSFHFQPNTLSTSLMYNTISNLPLNISIKTDGITAIENEHKRLREIPIQESINELNEINKDVLRSTLNLNNTVIPRFNSVQRSLTVITITIAFISFVAIAFSAYYSSKAPTSTDIQKLDSTLQKNSRLLDSLLKRLH